MLGMLGMAGITAAHAEEPGAGAAFSSGGADPTRPPASLQLPDPASGIDGAATAEAAGSGLQSIIFRKGTPSIAIIHGQVVNVGGRVGDARLVSLTESSATLQGPSGKEVLHLTPAVEIKPVKPPVTLTPKKKVRHKASKKKKIKKITRPPESESEQNPN